MHTVKLSVTGANITVVDGGNLTAGMVGVRYEVGYDPSWSDLGKVVVFSNGTICRNAVDGTVPWEVLSEPYKKLHVGIVGRNKDSTIVIPTIWADVGLITDAASESGDSTLEPTNPVWAQSATIAQQAMDKAQQVEDRAKRGELNGAPGAPGAPGIPGPKGDPGNSGTPGKNGKSAFLYAQEAGYTGTEADFGNSLFQSARLFDKDISSWVPVVELNGASEPWTKGYYWDASGKKVSTQYTKDYYASGKFEICPDCDYEIHGLNGTIYMYDGNGANGVETLNQNPTATIKIRSSGTRRYAAVNTKITGSWTPQRCTLTRTSISKEEYSVLPSNADQLKPLYGKKIVCFGDSLFGMYRGSTSAPAYAARVCGATVYNVGFGGCRMATHTLTGYAAFSMWALAAAVTSRDWSMQDAEVASGSGYFPEQLNLLKSIDFSKVHAAVIHYGTNDFAANVPLDADNKTDCNTICGALRYSISRLQSVFPELQIYVSLPVYRFWKEADRNIYAEEKRNGTGSTLADVCTALGAVAQEFNCPVIDGYHGLNINQHNAPSFLEDGTHHNQLGRKRFGAFIGHCLTT